MYTDTRRKYSCYMHIIIIDDDTHLNVVFVIDLLEANDMIKDVRE